MTGISSICCLFFLNYYHFCHYSCGSAVLLLPHSGKSPPTGTKTWASIPTSCLEKSELEILKRLVSTSPDLNLSLFSSYLFSSVAHDFIIPIL